MNTSNQKRNVIYQSQAVLARRDHSEHEVRQKLAKKRFSPDEIQRGINYLYEQQLLDDAKFADRFCELTLSVKPVGRRWLAGKLRQRGIQDETAQVALDTAYEKYSESALAQEAATRWRRSHPKNADNKEKMYRFLASRGFSIDSIESATTDVYTNT